MARGRGTSSAKAPSRPRAGTSRKISPIRTKDIRFTTKGQTLYAIALGWPDEEHSSSSRWPSPRCWSKEGYGVRLLGHEGTLEWSRTDEGLVVKLPEKKPCEHAFALKISMTP